MAFCTLEAVCLDLLLDYNHEGQACSGNHGYSDDSRYDSNHDDNNVEAHDILDDHTYWSCIHNRAHVYHMGSNEHNQLGSNLA